MPPVRTASFNLGHNVEGIQVVMLGVVVYVRACNSVIYVVMCI